ncbi:MAG: hypothetical protein L0Z73_14955 [Gammaproteobacteria bacterium]|nr:hypothetical protein [Gammaproteobacteria bacterium]
MPSTLFNTVSFTGLTILFLLLLSHVVYAKEQEKSGVVTEPSRNTSEAQVIQAFTAQDDIESEIIKIDDQRKRQIMFAMGVPLLLFIFITAGLGIAMGIFGKEVYIAHMIFAGLSLTLALGHAIVGLVWFWPF